MSYRTRGGSGSGFFIDGPTQPATAAVPRSRFVSWSICDVNRARLLMNHIARAWISLGVLALMMGVLLFASAGTISYWQAWLYLAIFFGGSVLTTVYVIRHDPALLERRMRGGPTAE